MYATMEGSFALSGVSATDLTKCPSEGINTGVGFFDHMLDQLNSHAQVGISVTAKAKTEGTVEAAPETDRNRYADPPERQAELMSAVGDALGCEIGKLVEATKAKEHGRSSRFCCPLDEALVECTLTVDANGEGGKLGEFTLSPYGIYPSPGGRTRIGKMAPAYLNCFFDSLARSSALTIDLRKIRGDNGHHVVESAFKAFSRALRNLLDGTTTTANSSGEEGSSEFEALWGVQSDSYKQGLELNRTASISRKTKETSIDVALQLDWMHNGVSVSTGLSTLDAIFAKLAQEAKMSLSVKCAGDTWVDDHHTTEDVGIAIGQCLNKALGTKAGLNRMWCARACVLVVHVP